MLSKPSKIALLILSFSFIAPALIASSRFHFKSNIRGVSVIDAQIIEAPRQTDYDQYRIAVEVRNTTENRIIVLDSQVCYGMDTRNCQQIYFTKHFWPHTTNWSEQAQLKNYEQQADVTVTLTRIQTIAESDDASVGPEKPFCGTMF